VEMTAARRGGWLLVLLSMALLAPCLGEHSPLVSQILDQQEMGEAEDSDMAEEPTQTSTGSAVASANDLTSWTSKMGNMIDGLKDKKADWPTVLESIRNGVVQLKVVQEKFLWSMPYRIPMRETIFGSGFFLHKSEFGVDIGDDIIVVTNAHVAKQASSISLLIPELGKEPVKAIAVGVCVQRDIALVKVVNPTAMLKLFKERTGRVDIVRMKLGDSDALAHGAPIMAVGFPLGMQSLKSSTGVVSGYQQFSKSLYMSITAPINPGNSGGPLYNKRGEVVGINSAKLTSAARIAFAIPSKQLKVALDGLYLQREFIEPEVGIITSVGTEDLNQYLTGLKSTGGVYIKQVTADGLFAEAGGAEGDLLLAIDGHKVDRFGKIYHKLIRDRINVQGLLLRHEIGSDITFSVYRSSTGGTGSLMTLTAPYKFTKRPNVHFLYEPIVERPKFVTFAGFVFMKLNLNLVEKHMENNPKELVKYMDPVNRGEDRVIISSLEPASLAHKDGAAEDVTGLLVKTINGMTVRTMDDLCAALNARTLPNEFWTLETAKSFSSLKVSEVLAYEQADGVKDDVLHQSAFSGCAAAQQSGLKKAFRK